MYPTCTLHGVEKRKGEPTFKGLEIYQPVAMYGICLDPTANKYFFNIIKQKNLNTDWTFVNNK